MRKTLYIDNPPLKRDKIKFNRKIVLDYLFTLVAFGLNRQPSIRDYYKKNDLFGCEFVKKLIKSENKFFKINQQIHFDPHFLLKKLNSQFKKFYDPENILVIDESLILFKGKCSFRQHIKNKPNSTGL